MVHRLLNAGRFEIGGTNLLALLEQVAEDQKLGPELRREARKHWERHYGVVALIRGLRMNKLPQGAYFKMPVSKKLHILKLSSFS